jgi:ABC-type multidrug transport system ATPase subunit
VKSHLQSSTFLREWLANNVSYVQQSDVLFSKMTVREHLTHAAWLMLPEFMTIQQKLDRVTEVLKILELEGCADIICGDGGVKIEGGISGGQRRRVSVAAQLLRLPAAMLLDEPTSGLDSTSALTLVKSLSKLAKKCWCEYWYDNPSTT